MPLKTGPTWPRRKCGHLLNLAKSLDPRPGVAHVLDQERDLRLVGGVGDLGGYLVIAPLQVFDAAGDLGIVALEARDLL